MVKQIELIYITKKKILLNTQKIIFVFLSTAEITKILFAYTITLVRTITAFSNYNLNVGCRVMYVGKLKKMS